MGVAAHSGWAAVVVLGEAPKDPTVLARSRIRLVEEGFPESKQPYHAVESLGVEEAAQRLDRYRSQAEGLAHRALCQIDQDLGRQGYGLRSIGVLDSAGRKGDSLNSILASHALIHAADGDHFRNAVAAAAARIGVAVHRVPARELEFRAETRLQQPLPHLQSVVGRMRAQIGPPWGADQKNAALLAWLLLAP